MREGPPDERSSEPGPTAARPSIRWGIAVALAVQGAVGLLVARSVRDLLSAAEGRKLAFEAVCRNEHLLNLMGEAETGERGYLLTGDPDYLRPYLRARGEIRRGGPPGRLGGLVAAKLAELEEAVALRHAGRAEAALAIVRTHRGRGLMDAIRAEIESRTAEEAGAVRRRDEEVARTGRRTLLIIPMAEGWCLAAVALSTLAARRDHARRLATERALARSELTFRAIARHAPDALVMADRAGIIRSWNEAAGRTFGLDEAEAVGAPVTALMPPRYRAEHRAAMDRATRSGRLSIPGSPRELAGLRKDGSEFPIELTLVRFELDGSPHYCAIVRDITERKRAAEELGRARDELERRVLDRTAELARVNDALRAEVAERRRAEADAQRAREAAEAAGRAKDRFLAVLSHELRTPLTPVLMAVTALLDDPGSMELRAALEMIGRNIELEARLIDDLLDLTRIARGAIPLKLEMVDVHGLIRSVLESCRGEIRAAGLEVAVDLAAPGSFVAADPARLRQVLRDLVRNATRFAPPGQSVRVRTRNEPGPTGGRLVVEVSDTGIGIDPGDLGRIFDPFERGDAPPHRRPGGLGLGLAIGRSVAEAHGGSLTASSPGTGLGSTFTLDLPALLAPPAGPPSPAPPPSGLRILLVEDNPDSLRYLALLLGRRHAVRSADTLASALALADPDAFDLVISDIELPDGTGLDLMRHLSARGPVPAIAMSGFGSEFDIRLSLEAGFREHLTKPVDARTLEAIIRRILPT